PKTFPHAFQITRFLGLRYIWIDSLCSIPDSGKDRNQEFTAMADIYSNAIITTAATSAASPDSGLYSIPAELYRMRRHPQDDDNSKALVRPKDNLLYRQHDIRLLKRAWVL
ncbi:uncharacterized protein M421DRAFT_409590, partial [Didymella exigua CBS 183.55]